MTCFHNVKGFLCHFFVCCSGACRVDDHGSVGSSCPRDYGVCEHAYVRDKTAKLYAEILVCSKVLKQIYRTECILSEAYIVEISGEAGLTVKLPAVGAVETMRRGKEMPFVCIEIVVLVGCPE